MPNGEETPIQVPPIPDADQKELAQLQAQGIKESGTWTNLWASLFAGLAEGAKVILSLLVEAFEFYMTAIAEFMLIGQGEKTTQFYKLVAAITSDLTGVEVDAQELDDAHDARGRIGGMETVGANLFDLLAREFLDQNQPVGPHSGATVGIEGLPKGTVTPDSGVKAAQAFMGFLMSFAVRQGNIAVLSQFLSANGVLGTQEFREYGEMMARNLGLGRLSRRALQPLIQTMISDPLQQALHQQYRPKILTEKQYVTAHFRGEDDLDAYHANMALLGYSEERADKILRDEFKLPDLKQLVFLKRAGQIEESDFRTRARAQGWNLAELDLYQKALDLEEVRAATLRFTDILTRQFVNGWLTDEEFAGAVNKLDLPDLLKAEIIGNAFQLLSLPRRLLTLTEMENAYIHATIDLDEFKAYLVRRGYSEDDQSVLVIELLLKAGNAEAHAKAKADKAAAKLAKPPKPPTPKKP